MNDKIKKQIEEAIKAEFDLSDTLNKYDGIPVNEYCKKDIEDNLDSYGMHIEESPESIVYLDMIPYEDEDIKELVKEYAYYIMSNPSKIKDYLMDFAKDLLGEDDDYYEE